jgi:hypothetical protein
MIGTSIHLQCVRRRYTVCLSRQASDFQPLLARGVGERHTKYR